MKIVIAPDSFKGSMTSMQASLAIKRGIMEVDPSVDTVVLPMADGGEGTVDAVMWRKGGEKIHCRSKDPLGREIIAKYGWIEQDRTAVIETAAASGLTLLKTGELDPEKASSYGTGVLMKDAIMRGAETIILGLGGSATVDAGTGLLRALGVKFFDENGKELDKIGGRLQQISTIDFTALDPVVLKVKILAASDVTNPLLGENGAVSVFGPQKGVTEGQLAAFEEGMRHFSSVAVQATMEDKRDESGSGAAGGIGFSLKTFLGAEYQNGLELVAQKLQLENELADADLLITGEGRIDSQSAFGKVPVGLGRLAKKYNVPVVAFAGSIGSGAENLREEGVFTIVPITEGPIELEDSMVNGELLLYRAAKRLMQVLDIGESLSKKEKEKS